MFSNFIVSMCIACGYKGSIATSMVGSYSGSIAESVTNDSYSVNADDVYGDTISLSGADCITFQIDIFSVVYLITQIVYISDTTLPFQDGKLDSTDEGSEKVGFSGNQWASTEDSTCSKPSSSGSDTGSIRR